MAIDKPGENRHRPPLDPADRFGPLPSAKIIIIARCGDPSVFDNNGPIPPAAQVAKFRRIDQETANAKQFTLLFHKRTVYENITPLGGWQCRSSVYAGRAQKRFGQRTPRRNSKHQKRATTRIALTC
jgi:hypothetical protein